MYSRLLAQERDDWDMKPDHDTHPSASIDSFRYRGVTLDRLEDGTVAWRDEMTGNNGSCSGLAQLCDLISHLHRRVRPDQRALA